MARRSAGLLGRILAILFLAIGFEFAASTFLYERAEILRMQDEEAHRVGEHVAIAYQFLASRPPAERPAAAARLSSRGVTLRWRPGRHEPPAIAPSLNGMRDQIIRWEPLLASAQMKLYLHSPGRQGFVKGSLRLPDGSTLIFTTPQPVDAWSLTLNRVLLALIPAIALVVIAALMIRRTLRPMDALVQAAGVIGRGGEMQVPVRGSSEVRRLIRAFNDMQGRIHQLIADRTQALAAVGHDLRTPMARLQLRTEQVADPELRAGIQADADEMEQMLDSLLAFLRGEGDPEPRRMVDAAVLVRTLIEERQDLGEDVVYAGPDHLERMVRPLALRRALGNLVENAIRYGGSAAVTLGQEEGALVLHVDDQGPGIPDGDIARAMEPFVRLDAARARNTKGLGLGLAIVGRVVAAEGGTLALSNRLEGGLRAEIRLS